MIKVIPYAPGHFDFLKIRHVYAGDSELEQRMSSLIGGEASLSYTIIKDDRAIAVLGGVVLWPRVMEVWTVTTDLITEYPLEFHKKVSDTLNGTSIARAANSIKPAALSKSPAARAWRTASDGKPFCSYHSLACRCRVGTRSGCSSIECAWRASANRW